MKRAREYHFAFRQHAARTHTCAQTSDYVRDPASGFMSHASSSCASKQPQKFLLHRSWYYSLHISPHRLTVTVTHNWAGSALTPHIKFTAVRSQWDHSATSVKVIHDMSACRRLVSHLTSASSCHSTCHSTPPPSQRCCPSTPTHPHRQSRRRRRPPTQPSRRAGRRQVACRLSIP